MSNIKSFPGTEQNSPKLVSGTVPPNRTQNDLLRGRKYLKQDEIDKLLKDAKKGRQGHRDHTMILMAYRHGLRVSELCNLMWDQVSFADATLYVKRLKGSRDSTHFLEGDELRALRRLKKANQTSPYVFLAERRDAPAPVSTAGFRKMFSRLGVKAEMPWPINPHMLRHSCGHALANKGRDTRSLQSYLGHANIMHTVQYTEIAPGRFKDFWTD